ncbi:MAG: hypothetical protein DMG20_05950 [Acidobacteria bacterium]|nr:MAG: hypothetical protein DMG20_05950 [Acidobacteriota bacterium]
MRRTKCRAKQQLAAIYRLVIFASSVIVADGGTVISIPQATNLMNAPIFSITPTIIDRTSPIIFMRQTAISLPVMIRK